MSASTTNPNTDSARRWAEDILRQLGAPSGHTLTVTRAAHTESAETAEPQTGRPGLTSRLRTCPDGDGTTAAADEPGGTAVRVTLEYEDGSSVSVRLTPDLSEAQAVVLLAEQLQDSVLESTHGAPAPACPGHGHPATARVIDGTASWSCPQDGRTWPILS
ncbi:hypothetical protein [Streptomyces sp. NPDC088725]|uniref:hypothetical protein n=1 Tax=Streptomyces sp. NPDC088725 TaxID=3365873 RepID=UPI00380B88FD